MPCPRCQHQNRPQAKFCEECATPLNGAHLHRPPGSHADPTEEVEGLRRALSEALEQQTATAEILRVISSSPTDVRPVFDVIAKTAARLCQSFDAAIYRPDGDRLVLVAHHGAIPLGPIGDFSIPFVRGTVAGQSMLSGWTVHVADVQTEGDEFPQSSQSARQLGFRTILCVPLMREGVAIGSFSLRRIEVQLFTDRQVALLETFADQAVIAIENVRLFKELETRNRDLTETLEQQTATAEILRVISSSPTDVRPVFDAIVTSAVRLCGGVYGAVYRRYGDMVDCVAHYGLDPDEQEFVRRAFPRPVTAGRSRHFQRALVDGAVVSIADIAAEPDVSPRTRDFYLRHGGRCVVLVPLVRQSEVLGVLGVGHRQIGAFSDNQLALLKTFADQAVIAIENVRLFKELQASNRELTEALEQQTATGEILRVISLSPTDTQPVFDAIVERALRLSEATIGAVTIFDGELIHVVASNLRPDSPILRVFPMRPSRTGSLAARTVFERRIIHVPDALAEPEYNVSQEAAESGYRSVLSVPMLRDGTVVGTITVGRSEAGSYLDRQIALLQTFADQAVIAIENVRLFKELGTRNKQLTEALEQQIATSEILRVISSSPTDIQPVLDTMAENAVRLCEAERAVIFRFDGELLRAAAYYNVGTEVRQFVDQNPIALGQQSISARAGLERRTVHIPDLQADPASAYVMRDVQPIRTMLAVPMLKGDDLLGTITIYRLEVNPFTDKQVSLVETFADQAVIAIENARLLSELQQRNETLTQVHAQVSEALEQQTATAEILRVISSSPTDVQPVFDAIAAAATRLCAAQNAGVFLFDGTLIHFAAHHNWTAKDLDAIGQTFPRPPGPGTVTARAILTRAVAHTADISADPAYEIRGFVDEGFHAILSVPMLRDGEPIGAISVTRREAVPFTDKQIALLQTFADQAVIAVENVRLFKELQARTGELSQSVEQLMALGEVSRAVSSTLDVETVLDTIVSRANQLAGADACGIYEYDEDEQMFHVRATHNFDAAFVARLRVMPLHRGEGVAGRATAAHEPIQVVDIAEPGAYESRVRDLLIGAGYRAVLSVPLLREEQIIGSLSLVRKVPGEYSPEVIEVLKTFATQSALAIQNARLFREIADKSRQLEAASQHKSEFLANMSHELRTPLNAILGFSEVLAQGMFGEINEKQSEYLNDILESGRHLLSLINDILDLSKIEAGRMELEASEFDLPQAIQNALTLVRERALRRGIALHHAIDDRVAEIRGDERKVKQVLLNLLSNAIKFTPEGGRIEVRAASTDRMVEVSVTDSGVGIAPEDQEAVFEEFRQVGATDKKAEGTGLGLALSRKFIELHGGKIWVNSELGSGSTFTFTLPVRT